MEEQEPAPSQEGVLTAETRPGEKRPQLPSCLRGPPVIPAFNCQLATHSQSHLSCSEELSRSGRLVDKSVGSCLILKVGGATP